MVPARNCFRLSSSSCQGSGPGLLRRAHGLLRGQQIPIRIFGGDQGRSHLLAERFALDLLLVLRHFDEGAVHVEAEAVEKLLADGHGETGSNGGIEEQVQLRGALPLQAVRDGEAGSRGEGLDVVRGEGHGAGGDRGDAGHHQGVQRAGRAVFADVDADGGVEESGRADADAAGGTGDTAGVGRAAAAAAARGSQNAAALRAGEYAARDLAGVDAARRRAGAGAQKVGLRDRRGSSVPRRWSGCSPPRRQPVAPETGAAFRLRWRADARSELRKAAGGMRRGWYGLKIEGKGLTGLV